MCIRDSRSGEAISLVAPDEEKLLKSIERVTRQKIPDGDLMGFDAAAVEAEKPEVREPRPQNNQRRGQRADGSNAGGRKDKGRDKGKEKDAGKDGKQSGEKAAEKSAGGRQEQRKPRDKKPRQQQNAQQGAPAAPANRDPEEFLDDDIDNFGNRADYVSPYQGKGGQGRNLSLIHI